MTFEATVFDGHSNAGDTNIEAVSMSEAFDKAETWAKDGDWDHPGTVTLRVVGADGSEESRPISVG